MNEMKEVCIVNSSNDLLAGSEQCMQHSVKRMTWQFETDIEEIKRGGGVGWRG